MNKFFICLLLLITTIVAQDKNKKDWDVLNPPLSFKDISFTTNEGTWMNLDVSPDGKEIVFDLLGDIYIIPITGGDAEIIRGGISMDVQPRFSPNGKQISFTSDAGGGDNIWIMDVDGENAKQITKESYRLLNNAIWTKDGNYLIARKHFTSTRSIGAGEMWMYHTSGGTGFQLTKKKNVQQDVGEPCLSPDGKYLYYSEDVYPGGSFQYNKDPNSQIYVIKRYNIETGETENVITGAGGAVRPQISPDGKLLAFVKRVRTKSVLYVHNLATREQWPVYDKLSKDQQEAWAIFGVYTNFNWLPDNKHIVIWADGKINKINIETKSAVEIPFSVEVNQKVAETIRFNNVVDENNFEVKVIRHAVTSSNGKYLIFNAVGYLWKKNLPDGTPERLTSTSDFEFEPTFSKDGNKLVYVTWSDDDKGKIVLYNFNSKISSELKLDKGSYREPSFSSEGSKILYRKESGNSAQGYVFTKDPGIYVYDLKTEKTELISKEGSKPQFDKTNNKVFYLAWSYEGGSSKAVLKQLDLSTKKVETLYSSKYATEFKVSPDNKWLAFRELHNVYITPFIITGKKISLSAKSKSVAIAKLSRDAGINLHWASDSKKLNWTLGGEYFSNQLKDRFTFLDGAPDELPKIDTTGIRINLVLKTDKPKGRIALKGGTIISMKGDEIYKNGIVLINGNKIEKVGKENAIKIPSDAKVIDVTGKYIMPGIIDVHAHLGTWSSGMSPQKQSSYYANLAYGITTTHDPSSNTEKVFTQSEMVKAGNMIGPRIYSTGTILYGAEGNFKAVINNLEDARSAIRRTKAFGAFSVKSYNQPRREQRQQVMKAANELGINVYPEGGSTFFHNLSMLYDGHTGIEHNLPIAPLFNDVVQLWKNTGTGYTPTLIVCYGSMNGEYYWYQKTEVWNKTRLLNFYPRTSIDSRSRHRTMIPDEEYENGHILVSKSCKKLNDAGVKVNVGGHGQLQGLGVHWEMWMLAQGGMTNMEVIRAATMNGAHYLGMDSEIGSIEEGKVADIIVLDKNPLDDIHNTEFVKYTIINGRIYDSETLNEIGNYNKKRKKFYFENDRTSYPGNNSTSCSCGL